MTSYLYKSIADIVATSEKENIPFWEVVERAESEKTERPIEEICKIIKGRLDIFRQSVREGLADTTSTASGMSGGQGHLLKEKKGVLLSDLSYRAMVNAIAVSEANAKMFRVVACPTAGSCGILPGCFTALEEMQHSSEEDLINGLLAAAGVGNVITNNATVAGAVGGCQAECGAASAMAAAGIVTILGGTAKEVANAAALAMKNVLGLVCDPVAGLVEVPCVKRNGFHAVHSLTAAEMSLQGLISAIPVDEVIQVMWEVGIAMPCSLRETSQGGLATSPTGLAIAKRVENL